MIELECMSCKSCGGKLVHQEDNVWYCEYCDKYSIVNVLGDPANLSNPYAVGDLSIQKTPFTLRIRLNGEEKKIESSGNCTVLFEYKKRATAADRYPANLLFQTSNGKFLISKDLPRFKYSKVQILPKDADVVFNIYAKNDIVKSTHVRYGEKIEINDVVFDVVCP